MTAMHNKLGDYVSSLCGGLRVDSRTREEIDREVRAHLEDHTNSLTRRGLSDDEASHRAIRSFGNPGIIARDLIVVHSQGTWKDAFLTSLPHLLVALLLTAYYRHSVVCLLATVLVAGLGAHLAVSRRAPPWSFSWLGYCLVPVILAALLLLNATHWWTLLGIAYIPCAVLVVVYVVRQTASRDLLYVSLMLAPWAVITAWCIATQSFSGIRTGSLNADGVQVYGRELVGSFVALAISSFVFARIRPRWGKALALIIPLAGVLGYVSLYCGHQMSLWGWLIAALAVLLVSIPTVREFRG